MKFFYHILHDLAALFRVPYTRTQRHVLLVTYFKCVLWSISGAHVTSRTHIRVGRIVVEGDSFEQLWFLFREIFIHGDYHFSTKKDAPTIFDVGGNIGMATCYFKWLYPKAHVHVFEPNPAAWKHLDANVQVNQFTQVHIHHVALSDTNGAITLHTNSAYGGMLTASIHQRSNTPERVEVRTKCLSDYAKTSTVDLLKMDVEGAEIAIVRDLDTHAAWTTIQECVIEYHHHLDNAPSRMSTFFHSLEKAGFHYVLHTHTLVMPKNGAFQDILIRGYRSHDSKKSSLSQSH